MSYLTPAQIEQLLRPINPRRVNKDGKGFSHVEAYDIRAHLIRIFGFGNFSAELLSYDLIFETQHGEGHAKVGKWDVGYRAMVRLSVGDAVYTEAAVGDVSNFPSRADAHDMAIKTAESQALKRCATNLGDQFGLSLYNDGSPEPVVLWSAAHPPKPVADEPAAPMPALDADPPVKPEPQAQQEEQRQEPTPAGPPAEDRPRPRAVPQPAPDPDEREAALAAMWDAAKQTSFVEGLPSQFASAFGHPIEDGTADEFMQARQLMVGSAAA